MENFHILYSTIWQQIKVQIWELKNLDVKQIKKIYKSKITKFITKIYRSKICNFVVMLWNIRDNMKKTIKIT